METEAKRKRLRVWAHNACRGSARFMVVQAHNIANRDSTTQAAKILARRIEELATQLDEELKTRIDP